MENNYCVYIHISPNNKKYIGLTCQKPEYRWHSDGSGYKGNNYFWNAINKYSWDNFKHIIVAKGLTKEEAKWLEMKLIEEWDSVNPNKGYNILSGGQTNEGKNNPMFEKYHTEETKEKMSENHWDCSGKNNPMFGKKHTEETKEKMSKVKSGKQLSEETKEKISKAKSGENNPMFGEHHTEETKQKISKNRKGKLVGKNHPNAESIICITTIKIFYTIKEGAEYYNLDNSSIVKCCKRKIKTCGKLKDGTPLVWRYLTWKHNKKYRIK